MDYAKFVSQKETDVTKEVVGKNQIKNNDGGFVFPISKMDMLKRFLILGSEGGSYYVGEEKLTVDNAKNVIELIKTNGEDVLDETIRVSENGLARKNDSAIFVLALLLTFGKDHVKRASASKCHLICRIPTHLFMLAKNIKQLRGWGGLIKETFKSWYYIKGAKQLAFHYSKYKQRDGWSHRDLLRLNHIKPRSAEEDILYKYIVSQETVTDKAGLSIFDIPDFKIIEGNIKAKEAKTAKELVEIIIDYGLTAEMIPTEFKNNKEVQKALLPNLGYTALIRSLGAYSASGLIDSYDTKTISYVVKRITEPLDIKRSRIHPIQLLEALKTYSSGRGFKGGLSWTINGKIKAALNEAFYLSFANVEPTGQKIVLALDISGSMSAIGTVSGSTVLSAREVTAAFAMVIARTEKNYIIKGFSDKYIDLPITPDMNLDDVIRTISNLPFSSTNCSLPMADALTRGVKDIDAFIVFTDNDTNNGATHPFQALTKYRLFSQKATKMIVCSTQAYKFSIADPSDKGSLDIVGFSADCPSVINQFLRGEI